MNPKQFWKTTPRKFCALCDTHADLNTPPDRKGKGRKRGSSANQRGQYIDQLTFM